MDGESEKPKQERLRWRWTVPQDKVFVDLVVEQIQLGSGTDNALDQKAWKHVRDQFNASTGLNFNTKQLRKHLDVLRTRYYNLKSASDQQQDFGFEKSSQVLMMPEFEYKLFADLIQEIPKAENLKIKECPIYDQLSLIFTEPISDGRYAQSSHFGKVETIGGPKLTSCPQTATTDLGTARPRLLAQSNASAETTAPFPNGRKRGRSENPPSPSHDTENQEIFHKGMAAALLDMISASRLRATATTQTINPFSITNCIKALDEIRDMNDGLYFAALDLFDDSCNREMFLSLKHENRLAWLQHRCKTDYSSIMI